VGRDAADMDVSRAAVPASTLAAIFLECVYPKRRFHQPFSGPPHRPHVIKSPSLQRDCCTSELSPPVNDSIIAVAVSAAGSVYLAYAPKTGPAFHCS
jgi:hypothetical protein